MISDVDQAIRRALPAVLDAQQPDGSWQSVIDTGPALTAQGLVALHYLNALDEETARSCLRWIRWQQLDDGSFPAVTGAATGDPLSTASCLAGLAVSRLPEYERSAAGARSFLAAQGGMAAVVTAGSSLPGTAALMFLAVAGLLDAGTLPEIPLLPAIATPAVRFLAARFHPSILMMLYQLDAVRDALMGGVGLESPQWTRRLLAENLVAMQTARQNGGGHWNSSTGETLAALVAFRAAGLAPEDDRIRRGVMWLSTRIMEDVRGSWFCERRLDAPLTASAVETLLTVRKGGALTPLTAACDWLADKEGTAGRAFRDDDRLRPHTGVAGVVLSALGDGLNVAHQLGIPEESVEMLRAACRKGADWLRRMQNPDGGWPCSFRGLLQNEAGMSGSPAINIPTTAPAWLLWFRSPPARLGDPSDVVFTAAALSGLAKAGYGARTSTVRSGLAFLRGRQFADGSFGGCPSHTALVIRAAAALKIDGRVDWLARAIDYLIAEQRPDGGWSEADGNLGWPGEEPVSETWLTGLICAALIEAGQVLTVSVNRGILFLLQRQHVDGSWEDNVRRRFPWSLSFVAPADLDMPLLPLLALGKYREASD